MLATEGVADFTLADMAFMLLGLYYRKPSSLHDSDAIVCRLGDIAYHFNILQGKGRTSGQGKPGDIYLPGEPVLCPAIEGNQCVVRRGKLELIAQVANRLLCQGAALEDLEFGIKFHQSPHAKGITDG